MDNAIHFERVNNHKLLVCHMLMEPRRKLDTYIGKIRSLQQGLERTKESERRATLLLSGGYSNLYSLTGEIRKKEFLSQQEQIFQALLSHIKEFLRTISVKKKDLPLDGNSARFLEKLATIEGYFHIGGKNKKNDRYSHTD